MTEDNELSEREREILSLVAKGASNKEIARTLFISTNTVKVHLRNIFAKIGASSRTEAAMYAISSGLIDLPSDGNGDRISQSLTAASELSLVVKEQKGFSPYLRMPGLLVILLIVLTFFAAFIVNYIRSSRITPIASANTPVITGETRWVSLSPLPTARKNLALVVIGDLIYAIGGETQTGVTGASEVYDISADTWTQVKDKPTPVSEIQAGVVGGKIFIPGGKLASGEVTNLLEVFDPEKGVWEVRAPLPVGLSGYGLATFEGKLYLFGGWDGYQVSASTFEYNPDLDGWRQLSSMPTARVFPGVGVSGGKLFVFGGFDGQSPLAVNEIYLPEREGGENLPWVEAEPLPEPRYAMAVASLADIIHVVGGLSDQPGQLPSLEFTASRGTWEKYDSPLPSPWSELGMTAAGTHLYLVGGNLNNTISGNVLSYQAIYLVNLPVIR
jgi:DNA-binding CsgD family transcriptional regulator